MKFPEDMRVKDKIEFLERYILVHSYLYYHLDTTVISDKKFDKYASLLASKIQKIGSKVLKTQYGYVFYDFDGSTAFDLIDRLNKSDKIRIKRISNQVIQQYTKESRKVNK